MEETREIWKYTFESAGNNLHQMPVGALILDVQLQRDLITMWVMVNPDTEFREDRMFFITGTGHKFDWSNKEYLSTVQGTNGLVWHVFESKRRFR